MNQVLSDLSTGHRGRWVVLAALIGVYFSFGIVVSSLAPVLTVVREELDVSRSQMGFALGAWAMIFIVTAPIAGRFIDRFGLGWAVTIGGLSIAASAAARAAAQGFGSLWFAVALFGVGGPLVSAAAPTLVTIWFPDESERRRSVGIYVVAPTLGGAAALALTNSFLVPLFETWRGVLLAEASFAMVATAIWVVVYTRTADGTEPVAAVQQQGGGLAILLGSKSVRFAFAIAFSIFFVQHALLGWLPTMLSELGSISAGAASSWVATASLLGVTAAIVVPRYANDRRRVPLFVFVWLVICAALLVLGAGPEAAAVPATLILGVRNTLLPLGVLFLMEAEGVDSSNAGLANGLWFSIGEVGGVSGPVVVGLVSDSSGGFSSASLVLAAVAGITALITLLFTITQR